MCVLTPTTTPPPHRPTTPPSATWSPHQTTNLLTHQPIHQCYGYAFILLAYAAARKTGLLSNNKKLIEIFDIFEERCVVARRG